ncbi:transporter RarD family, DMT superfamily protein [Terrihabitans soli]|uniref:Transporter RarD family, DMT superfamily protein n=1 Tax=Terrihabitans soli TaxID=708113 RepID=A0A6S6QQM8_9HYPH|nr:DMT family transporter [Terrihabitans soli]BCJ91349.1 transporter RarD family, DMT superfamily protein [Terrihabitans soli]
MLTGILYKIASAFCFTVMAALIRSIGEDVPAGEVVFARSAFALVPILLWLFWQGQLGDVRTARPGGHFIRSSVGVLAMFCMFSGLARIPLPDATMIHYASPLITVVLAALVLGEPLRVPRVAAVLLGLLGVAVMFWPHITDGQMQRAIASGRGEGMRALEGALFALGGAFFTACAMIQIRRLVQTETTASVVFFFTVFSTLFGLATLPFGWVWPDVWTAVALVGIGILGGVGQIFLTSGYRYAEASVIAPFEYTTLIWALSIGWLAFGDLPGWFGLAGGLVVILSGFLVIRDERRRGIERARAQKVAQPPA